MQVGDAGSINLTIAQTSSGGAGLDVDFICWGPFSSLTGVCNQLTAGNIEDCSYSIASVETVNISNAQVGDYYVVLITNYSNSSGTIDFQQTSGSGEADCDVLNPCNIDAGDDQSICTGGSTLLGGNPSASGGDDSFVYSWSPVLGLDDPTSPNPLASPALTTIYTLTIDDEAGCVLTEDVTVTVVPMPLADAGPDVEIGCGNPSVLLDGSASSSGTYTWSTLDGNFTQTLNSAIISADQPGTYVLEVDAGAGCIGTDEVIVTAGDLTVEAVLSGPSLICGDEIGDFNVTIDQSDDWDITYSIDGVIQPITSISGSQFDFTSNVEGVYEIISITNGICNAEAVAPILLIVEAIPSVTFPSSNVSLCAGDSEVIDILLIGDGPLTFDYGIDMVSQGSTIEFQGPYSFNTSAAGTYAPISISSANCIGTVSGSFDVENLLSPTATLPFDYDICDGESALVTFEFTGSSPYEFEYTLNGVAQGLIISNDDSYSFDVSESAMIQLISLEDQNCTGLAEAASNIQLHPAPAAIISGDGTYCSGSAIILPVSLTGTGPFDFTYTLNGTAQPALNTSDPSFDLLVSEEGDYEIISISDSFCNSGVQNSINVGFYQPIDIDLEYESDICPSEPVIIEALVSGGQPGTYDFQWVDADGNTYSGNPIEVIPTADMTIDLLVNDDCDLPSSDQVSINVAAIPFADLINENYTICQGENADVAIDFTGSSPFEFVYTVDGEIQDAITSLNGTFYLPFTSAGVIELISVSDANCVGDVSGLSEVFVNALPSASISGGAIICQDESIILPIALVGEGPFEIQYEINGASQPIITTSDLTFDLDANIPGTYTVTSITDALCSDGEQNATTVQYFPPIVIELDYTSAVCENDTVTISAIASGGMSDGYSYIWSDLNENSYLSNPLTLVLDESSDFSIIVNDDCDQPSIQTFDIEVQAYPEPSFLSLEDSLCIGEVNEFLQTSQDGSTQCIWTFDDGVVLSGCDGVMHAFDSPGYHSLSLTATTSAGCSGIIIQDSVLYVAPDPIAEFLVQPVEGTIFVPEIQFENISQDAVQFDWEFGDGQLGVDHSPLHSYPGAIADYYNACLTAYNVLGCIDTVCHFLEIESEYLMSAPNAFTPDDDGVNDFFIPVFNDIVLAEYNLKIFNRLGEIVFESTDQFEPWNGAGENGSHFFGMDAVYFYRVVTREHNRSEKREHFGEVILIR